MSTINKYLPFSQGGVDRKNKVAGRPSVPADPAAGGERIDGRPDQVSTVLPLDESEQRILLEMMPDQVLRISLEDNGTVRVISQEGSLRVPTKAAENLDGYDGGEQGRASPLEILYEELARHGEKLMADFLETGSAQILEVQLDHDGQSTFHEVRATACRPRQLIALVRDVTLLRDAQRSAEKSTGELDRLNEVLQTEALLRAEEEKVIKTSFANLHDLLEDTISAISMIVRKKDPDTARHQERVSKLACAIAREMGLETSQVDVIGLAALLHDLGKVFVPSHTLAKTDKLTESEMAAVRSHAEAEFQVVKSVGLLSPVAEIVHQHHERLDGSGYPQGLRGDAILMEARVIAVADVVEAMLSDRPHRPALGLKQTIAEIAAGKGNLFDGRAVDACIRLFEERKFRFDEGEFCRPEELSPPTRSLVTTDHPSQNSSTRL